MPCRRGGAHRRLGDAHGVGVRTRRCGRGHRHHDRASPAYPRAGRDGRHWSRAVSAGRVEVGYDGTQVELEAGERLRIAPDGTERRDRLALGAIAAWRQGRLVLQDTSLAALADVLDRRLAGRIVILDQALAAERITGVFSLTDPLSTLRVTVGVHGGSVLAAPPFLILVVADGAAP